MSKPRSVSPKIFAAREVVALGVGADVTDRAALEQAFAKVRSELGPVSVLVTSAGLFGFSPFLEITARGLGRESSTST